MVVLISISSKSHRGSLEEFSICTREALVTRVVKYSNRCVEVWRTMNSLALGIAGESSRHVQLEVARTQTKRR